MITEPSTVMPFASGAAVVGSDGDVEDVGDVEELAAAELELELGELGELDRDPDAIIEQPVRVTSSARRTEANTSVSDAGSGMGKGMGKGTLMIT